MLIALFCLYAVDSSVTRSSAIAETARITIRAVMPVDQLTVTLNLDISSVNFISLIHFFNTSVPSYVASANTLKCFKSRHDKLGVTNNDVSPIYYLYFACINSRNRKPKCSDNNC